MLSAFATGADVHQHVVGILVRHDADEENELLTRESVPWDARLKSLVPTEKGAQVDAAVKKGIQEMEAELIEGISPGQRQVFLEVAAKISENLDRHWNGRG